ncbi:SDR family NAD(P)-dependent oxidoreductase [Streptomyces sp. NPDC002446]
MRSDNQKTLVAITGVGFRLPGGLDNLDALWTALVQGRDVVTEVPPQRFDSGSFVHANPRRPGKTYTAAGGFLDDIASFDAEYFGISPREAGRMDPQHRLLLEMTAEAVDDAGLRPRDLAGSDAGVFVGVSNHSYATLQMSRLATVDQHTMTGIASGNTANRISHAFDLRGPSLALDTACSSSLVALHHACELLRTRGGVALACGVNVLLGPHEFVGFSKAAMLSPTGRCRSFSAQADGFVRAEGGAVLVLKTLADAEAHGDRIHAVIAATGTNTDGRTPGLALPSADAQAALLRDVYAGAGLAPADLIYLEAHGTGTPVGDPLECRAIAEALAHHRPQGQPLPIGSIKSNVGHLEPASGLAGLLKALLVLRHRKIPASLHGEPANPAIDFPALNLLPVSAVTPVGTHSTGLVGINSFGFGGANAHAVLAPAPASVPRPEVPRGALPVMVSARTPQALEESAAALARHFEGVAPEGFYDTAYTTVRRRGHHPCRSVVLAPDPGTAATQLQDEVKQTGPVEALPRGEVAFVFSGNGAQWAGMGTRLLAESPSFRDAVETADQALTPLVGWSVRDELSAPDEGRLALTEVAQPLLFAVQVGLVAALAERGVHPAAVMGHSVGEIAAAYAAGALDLAAAARVVAVRSQAQALTAGRGAMAAVGLSAEQAERELAAFSGSLELAAVNSPQDVTVAGSEDSLKRLADVLAARQVFFRRLDLDYAFHSRWMDGIEEPLRTRLAGLSPGETRIPFASTVTGRLAAGSDLAAEYWWRNVREPVRFFDAVEALAEQGCDAFVEIGPHPVLAHYLRRSAKACSSETIAVVPTMARDEDGADAVDAAATHLMAAGATIDWGAWFPVAGRATDLPAYPWQRESHWNGSPEWFRQDCGEGPAVHSLLGGSTSHPDPLWQADLDPDTLSWLADHRVGGSTIVPAAAYVELGLAAGFALHQAPVQVEAMAVNRALALPFDDAAMDVKLQVRVDPEDGGLRISSRNGAGPWREHARGRIRRMLGRQPERLDPATLLAALPGHLPADDHYAAAARAGIAYGPAFQVLTDLYVGDQEVMARYAFAGSCEGYRIHPALLDAAIQAGAPLLGTSEWAHEFQQAAMLPAAVERVRVWKKPPAEGWAHVRQRESSDNEVCWDIRLLDDEGYVIAEVDACRLRRFASGAGPAKRLTTVLRAAPAGPDPDVARYRPPGPHELTRAVAAANDARRRRWDGPLYERLAGLVELMCAHFTLRAVEIIAPDRQSFSVEDLIAAGVLPRHRRLLGALLGQAQRLGLLHHDNGLWTREQPADPQNALARVLHSTPGSAAETMLYTKCGTHLPDVLMGRQEAVDLLFGDNEHHLLENLYTATPVARHYNAAAALLIGELARRWPADRPLRVLEIGAGTGGLTAALLKVLPPERTCYTFTDVSETFLTRARSRFAEYPHVRFSTLDIDREPAAQGMLAGAFDLVVAGNVLHATSDLRQSLHRVTEMLADGGHLLAIETHNPDVLVPCFGLLDSFWSSSDADLRPGHPLLDARQWPAVLNGCGFDEVAQIGAEADVARGDYSVLLARRADRPLPAPEHGQAPSHEAATSWLVVAEDPGGAASDALVEVLKESSEAPVAVMCATTDPDQWSAHLSSSDPRPGIVLLCSDRSDSPDGSGPRPLLGDEATLEQAVARTAMLGGLARACTRLPQQSAPRLWLVTRPSGALPSPDAPMAVHDAVPWGAARTLANELTKLAVRRVALTPTADPAADARRLARELLTGLPEEDEIALTPGGRFVARHQPMPTITSAAHQSHYQLQLRRPGRTYELRWVPAARPAEPGPGEVVIEVRAAGLNYRDVMMAAGQLPPGAESPAPGDTSLGLECAGVITAAGPGTPPDELKAGDRVFAFASGAMASHVVVPAGAVGKIPDHLSFTEAATMPAVFFTVHHGLEHLARLAPGETVLIHGAAGGVGLAALQYARHIGAHVIATAGTPAKRALLQLLGAAHVLNSRTLAFADQVRELTGGQGVDVILNSLAGEAIARNLDILRPGGRCVELGKRDIHTGGRLPLHPFRNNLTFHAVDAHQMLSRQPDLSATHFAEITGRTRDGVLRPVLHQVFPAAHVADAFAVMQHSRHVGKVVISLEDPPDITVSHPALTCDPTATYLVTGGLSGLGATTAEWLADRGARHLALLSRRGNASPEAAALLDRLAARGVTATAYAASVTSPGALGNVFADITATGHPLRGIVHSAMAIEDHLLTDLQDHHIRATLAPKVRGTALLDSMTRQLNLDFFVVYSSIAALVGNRAQAAYGAGNLTMEGVIRSRRAAGCHGLSVGWGLIGEVGAAADEAISTTLQRMGLDPIAPREAMAALEDLLAQDTTVATVGYFDWVRLTSLLPSLRAPRFELLRPPVDESSEKEGGLWRTLAACTEEDRATAIADLLTRLIGRVTHIPADRLNRSTRLDRLGLDSLMATELVVALQSELNCEVPAMEVINADSINDLAQRIMRLLSTAMETV